MEYSGTQLQVGSLASPRDLQLAISIHLFLLIRNSICFSYFFIDNRDLAPFQSLLIIYQLIDRVALCSSHAGRAIIYIHIDGEHWARTLSPPFAGIAQRESY